jgi:hypothetical protein
MSKLYSRVSDSKFSDQIKDSEIDVSSMNQQYVV